MSRHVGRFNEILLLEDNATAAERRRLAGVGRQDAGLTITVRVHHLNGASKLVVARKTYEAGSMRSKRSAKLELATELIGRAAERILQPVVVAGTSYGSFAAFWEMLGEHALPFVVQVRPSTVVQLVEKERRSLAAGDLLERGKWREVSAVMPDGTELKCSAAKLATVGLPTGTAKLFSAQVGGIRGIHRGTIIGLSSFDAALKDLVHLVAHASWIRRASRAEKRAAASTTGAEPSGSASAIIARANITLARRQDARSGIAQPEAHVLARGLLRQAAPILNVVELFSGAGGMGLGFLLGGGAEGRYRIVYSGEANPIFVQTLRSNHHAFELATRQKSGTRTPAALEAVDLRKRRVLESVAAAAKEAQQRSAGAPSAPRRAPRTITALSTSLSPRAS